MKPSGSLVALALSALALLVALSGHAPFPAARADDDSAKTVETRIAVVAAIRLMNELMESDRFKPERDTTEATLKESIAPIIEQGKALEERLRTLDQNSDEARQIKNQLMGLQGALARKQQDASIEFEKFIAGQTREAYRLIRESAVGIAEDRGFTYLIASQGADDEIVTGPVEGLVNDILGRPVMLSPESTDLTEEVREDLKLE